MNRIEFADGHSFEGECIDNGNLLLIKMTQVEAVRHISDFSNINKTKKICEYAGIFKNVYEGFTGFSGINVNPSGMYVVYLTGTGNYSHRKFFTVPREFVSEDMLGLAEFEN